MWFAGVLRLAARLLPADQTLIQDGLGLTLTVSPAVNPENYLSTLKSPGPENYDDCLIDDLVDNREKKAKAQR